MYTIVSNTLPDKESQHKPLNPKEDLDKVIPSPPIYF